MAMEGDHFLLLQLRSMTCKSTVMVFMVLSAILMVAALSWTDSFTADLQAASLLSAPSARSAKLAKAAPSLASSQQPEVSSSLSRADMASESMRRQSAQVREGHETDALPEARMLIKHGRLNLQAPRSRKGVEKAVLAVSKAVDNYGGYVEKSSQRVMYTRSFSYGDDERQHFSDASDETGLDEQERRRKMKGEQLIATLEVRVPVGKFDDLYQDCKHLAGGTVLDEGIEVEDVTSRYVDAAARVDALQATHDQLLDIMKRASEVSDVLKVQKELAIVRQDLEVFKKQTKWLERDATMSQLSLTITEAQPTSLRTDISRPWKAFENCIKLWKSLLALVIDASVYITALGLPLLLVAYLTVCVWRQLFSKFGKQ